MANELLGSGAKVVINNYVFDVKEGSCEETRNTARGDTTATGRVQAHVVDKTVVNLSCKAIRYSTLNPHIGPYHIASSDWDYADILYYPNGDDLANNDPTKSWRFRGIFTKYSESFNADQGLLMLDIACVSDGSYLRPGDA